MSNKLFIIALGIYAIALMVGYGADLIFPGHRVVDGSTVFYSSLTGGLTLLNLAVAFTATTILIGVALVRQAGHPSTDQGLLWRRLMIGGLFLMISVTLFVGASYVLSKRIIVDRESISYRSLIERREVQWSDVQSVNGNFVPGSRLGLEGTNRYAWVELITADGETVRFSLRFMRAIQEIQDVITERVEQT